MRSQRRLVSRMRTQPHTVSRNVRERLQMLSTGSNRQSCLRNLSKAIAGSTQVKKNTHRWNKDSHRWNKDSHRRNKDSHRRKKYSHWWKKSHKGNKMTLEPQHRTCSQCWGFCQCQTTHNPASAHSYVQCVLHWKKCWWIEGTKKKKEDVIFALQCTMRG